MLTRLFWFVLNLVYSMLLFNASNLFSFISLVLRLLCRLGEIVIPKGVANKFSLRNCGELSLEAGDQCLTCDFAPGVIQVKGRMSQAARFLYQVSLMQFYLFAVSIQAVKRKIMDSPLRSCPAHANRAYFVFFLFFNDLVIVKNDLNTCIW